MAESRVHNQMFIFLFLNPNICCGYSMIRKDHLGYVAHADSLHFFWGRGVGGGTNMFLKGYPLEVKTAPKN